MTAKKRVLILWSGGIDSTAVLKSYLEKTDFEIVALKINYQTLNRSKFRINKEIKAIDELLPKLLKIRNFEFKKIFLSIPHSTPGVDVMNFGNISIYAAAAFGCSEIIIGFVSDIRKNQIEYIIHSINKLNKISSILCESNKNIWKVLPKFNIPVYLDTKKNYIESLGLLVKDCWFCREPEKAGETNGCGKCHSCLHVKRSLSQLIEI